MRTDEQIAKIYAEGHGASHAEGLRKVYEAGQANDVWESEQRQVAADAVAASERARVAKEKADESAEEARRAKLTAAERKAEDDAVALEKKRAADAVKLAEENAALVAQRRKEDEALAAKRLAAATKAA